MRRAAGGSDQEGEREPVHFPPNARSIAASSPDPMGGETFFDGRTPMKDPNWGDGSPILMGTVAS